MFLWDLRKKIIVGVLAAVIVFSIGFYFTAIYQPPSKTDKIYSAALKDFNKGDYQNAYYLFSKISFFSKLKPIAVFHRAECAKMLGDDKSELKQYEFLFNTYPKHQLSVRSRYLAAQILVKDKPYVAKRYFEYILQKAPNTDYAIASEYYLGLILKNNGNKKDIENYFRNYITKAPSGRLALNAVNNWLEVSDKISQDDYLLMANVCYLFGEYEKAYLLLQKTDFKKSWSLNVKNSFALKDYSKVKSLTENGLKNAANSVSEDSLIDAVDIYIQLANDKNKAINDLLTISGKKDYLLNLKCQNSPAKDQEACYNNLYLKYPNGRFSADALSNIFFAKIKSGNIPDAKKIGKDFLNKYKNANSTPMVMFWMGKLYERTNDYNEYNHYYKSVINKFPDSYYAYRAYLKLSHLKGPIITSHINPKAIQYPYKYNKNNIIVKLVELQDYGLISEFAGDDDFIKSWVMYKKGDYANSMLLARDAMEKIQEKPDKYDLRWRLVYPVIFYDEIRRFAGETGNNPPLMLGLIREESYFDPIAQSVVGASGLMQIMPATANEINSKYSLGMNVSKDIFNPNSNIKIGNYYYEFLRNNLEGYDISSIAAYNGGIGSIQKWKTSLHYNDTDEFVEQIPYPETKNYVKKVFRSYWNYVRIYSGNE